MLQDIRSGKRTEIEALTGAVTTLATKLGIRVLRNVTIYHLIKFIEVRHLGIE